MKRVIQVIGIFVLLSLYFGCSGCARQAPKTDVTETEETYTTTIKSGPHKGAVISFAKADIKGPWAYKNLQMIVAGVSLIEQDYLQPSDIALVAWANGYDKSYPVVVNAYGHIAHGRDLYVNGIGFGIGQRTMKFENFESRTAGQQIGSEGYWSVYGVHDSGKPPRYSNEHSRTPASPTTAKFTLCRPQHDYAIKSGLNFQRKFYFDYWVRFQWAITGKHQIKLARLGSGTGDNYVYPHFVTEHWIGGSGCYSDARLGCGGGANTDWGYNCPPVGRWSHVQIAIDQGTPGGGNAVYHIWQDGKYRGGEGGFSWHCVGDPTMRQVWIGGYAGNAGFAIEAEIFYDDVSFKNGWDRVVLGNASKREDCTVIETQEVLSWTDTRIKIEYNRGQLNGGWLFVVNVDGTTSVRGERIN